MFSKLNSNPDVATGLFTTRTSQPNEKRRGRLDVSTGIWITPDADPLNQPLGADAYGDPYVIDDPRHGLSTQEEVDRRKKAADTADELDRQGIPGY